MYNQDIVKKILDYDEDVKNIEWASEMVRLVAMNAKELISKVNYDNAVSVLTGRFPDVNLDRLFKGATMIALKEKLSKDNALLFFERIMNTLIDERNKAELTITVNSLDPEKEEKKKFDKELLKNRKGIEDLLNGITGNNGMPPIKIEEDDFHGNVAEFDSEDRSEFDNYDIDSFFETWGLKQELHLQNAVNVVFAENEVKTDFDKRVKDILACLINVSRVFVDEVEGGIRIKSLRPYEVKVLHATGSNDFKDAQAITLPSKPTNIRGFIRLFGSHFNFDRDWQTLLPLSVGSNENYTGIHRMIEGNEKYVMYGQSGKTIDFNSFLDMPITYSYTEWKTISKTVTQSVLTEHGNQMFVSVPDVDREVNGANVKERYKEDTYYAYSLDTMNVNTPKIIKWGRVYMGEHEGLQDEYSGFTIKITKRDGNPVADILKPFHNLINVAFKMLEILINDIKPDGLFITYESAVKAAEFLKSATDLPNDAKNGMLMYLQSIHEGTSAITTIPEGPEGEMMGGGSGDSLRTKENGLNRTANDVVKIIDWLELKLGQWLGTQGIELADPNDGYKLTIENKKRTRAATSFIDDIMLNHFKDVGITSLNYIQDISKFKDIPAYKYYLSMLGYKVMEFIGGMEKTPFRYGTFIETFNNDIPLLEIKQRADMAIEKEKISLVQWATVTSIKNPKQAINYLYKEERKTEKKKRMDAMTALQQQDAINQKQFEREKELENIKGQWKEKAAQEQAKGFYTAAQINSTTQLQNKTMSEEGQNKRLATQAQNEINKIAETANIEAQKPVI